jgi:RNA polymerase primary sigma factor
MAPKEGERRGHSGSNSRPRRATARAISEAARERELLRAAHRGDGSARDRLVSTYLPLVGAVAARYRDYGMSVEDLVQEGSIGLLDAIHHYETDRGPEFVAYARFRIRRAIRNALTQQARLIRLPKQVVERRRALAQAEARLNAGGRRPTVADLAAATGLSVSAVIEARSATQAPVSLDEPLLAHGAPLEMLVADPSVSDPEVEIIEHEQRELLVRALAELPDRQRLVVIAQLGLDRKEPASAVELAAELSLSPRRTQTLGQDALYALREALEPVHVTS